MPEIGRIQSTNFQGLLSELGIVRQQIPFSLRSEVTPVVLVGGTVSFVAPPTPAYRVDDWFTEGELTAPAAGALFADTGQLPAGAYTAYMIFEAGDNHIWRIEWRNAANSATLRGQLIAVAGTQDSFIVTHRYDILNDNERVRIVGVATGTAAIIYQCSILMRT